MSTAYELQLQQQTTRRYFLLKIMLVASGILLLIVGTLGFYVTQPLFILRKSQPHQSVDPLRLETHVRAITESFGPRDESHPENLERIAAYIRHQFEQAQAQVSDQPFEVDGKTYRNVIAQFGPDTKERIVVGAHYDTAGPHPGADDNASGLAGLLELAHLLSRETLHLKVELVAYPLEEPPYFRSEEMGSAVHASILIARGSEGACHVFTGNDRVLHGCRR
jgi:hypothetical protein